MKISSCGGACLTVEEPGELFAVAEEQLNGMITNDKFCCTRWGQLQLSWWRRPLRLRCGAGLEPHSSTLDALRQPSLWEGAPEGGRLHGRTDRSHPPSGHRESLRG